MTTIPVIQLPKPNCNSNVSRVVFNLGRPLEAKVKSVTRNNLWCWPRRRNAVTREIMENIPSTLVPNSALKDSVVWVLHPHGFSVRSAWEAVRCVHPTTAWWKIVWFKFHVPRWAIIQWLAIKEEGSQLKIGCSVGVRSMRTDVCSVMVLLRTTLNSSFWAPSPL